jgi:hypothetical protein
VHAHERAGYEQLDVAVSAGEATADADAWLADYFDEVPDPRPPQSRLDLLARFVASEGRLPDYIPLGGREQVEPHRVAARLHEQDARRAERERAISHAYAANPTLVDVYYGGESGLRRAVYEELYRMEAGDPSTFDELRVPYVRAADRVDHRFGEGAHDLPELLERVRSDSSLFPDGLPAPSGGIRWTRRPFGSVWGRYRWDADSGPEPYIEINTLLDAATVDEDVVEFFIYHELLHHEDIHSGRKPDPDSGEARTPHDRDFRAREARHPAIIKANNWLDGFQDRLAAVDAEGRPVR